MQTTVSPVLEFLRDEEEHAVRFFRDSSGGAFQISLNETLGRVHHTWVNTANESLAFSIADPSGGPVSPRWSGGTAARGTTGGRRWVRYELSLGVRTADIGRFVLGSVREERDIERGLNRLAPYREMIRRLAALPTPERGRHLRLLHTDLEGLRARMGNVFEGPRIERGAWRMTVRRTTIDGKGRLALELTCDAREVEAELSGGHLRLRSRRPLRVTVTAFTHAPALRALALKDIFTREFIAWCAKNPSARRKRDLRSAEILFTRDKPLAGLKNYGTYFGRDTLMTALMMEDILRPEMFERILRCVLRKLSPEGRVSHEESVGPQAVYENVKEYNKLLKRGRKHWREARGLLGRLHEPREFYGMIDDDFLLPVLLGRYLRRKDVSPPRKRSFLRDPRVRTSLDFVLRRAKPYADRPHYSRLIGFPNDGKSSSWRDSAFGYAGGRYPMDVNAIWVPAALEAAGEILRFLDAGERPGLARAAAVWRGAADHFRVNLNAAQVRRRISARLSVLPRGERAYWKQKTQKSQGLVFEAIALNAKGRPIPVLHTDPSARLLLDDCTNLKPLLAPYPTGLFVERLGVLAANDVYAPPSVWKEFNTDTYHSPRVVWGRDMNILLLGLGRSAKNKKALLRLDKAGKDSGLRHNELWTYRLVKNTLRPVRYGRTCDIQLWNLASLAADFLIDRVRRL